MPRVQNISLYVQRTRGVQKVLQLDMMHRWHEKISMLLLNMHTLNNNTYVTFIEKLFDASQLEFFWRALQVRLSTQLPVWSHCHHWTNSSDEDIARSQWVPGLVSRVDVTAILIKCPLLQPVLQEQGLKMMTTNWRDQAGLWLIPGEHATIILFDWHERAFCQM